MKKNLFNQFSKTFLALFIFAGLYINLNAISIPISYIEDLENLRTSPNQSYFLTNDLDFQDDASYADPSNKDDFITGQGWMPIDNFAGDFNGAGHTIANLFIDRNQNNVGFFGTIESTAVIENLNLTNANVKGFPSVGALVGRNNGGTIRNVTSSGNVESESHSVGGLVGRNTNGGLLENITTHGTVQSDNGIVGGIVGINENEATIINSTSEANVTNYGDNIAGGIVGINDASIDQCYFGGIVTGDGSTTGGIVGLNNYNGVIDNSNSDGTVVSTGDYDIGTFYSMGGIVGKNNGSVLNASFTGEIEVTEFGFERVGGIVGWQEGGSIQRSFSTTSIEGNSYIGGLVGRNSGGTISESYSTGNIKGFRYVGGLIGHNEGMSQTIENCFATGNVESRASGNLYVGGFMGQGGDIYNSYSTGTVTEGDASGGFVGAIAGGRDYESSFWNVETSERTDDPAEEAGNNVKGLTTRGMKEAAVYDEWDITVVEDTENSYPMLDLDDNHGTIWYILQKPRQTVTFTDEEKIEDASVQVFFDEEREYKVGKLLETDSEGEASIELQEGNFWFTASAPGYDDYLGYFTVIDENVNVNFSLNEKAFLVSINENNDTENVSVKIFRELDNHYIAAFNEETKKAELYTDSEGKATVNLLNDDYVLLATKDGYMNYYKRFSVDGEEKQLNFTIEEITENYTVYFQEENNIGGAFIEVTDHDPDDFGPPVKPGFGIYTITDENGLAPIGINESGDYWMSAYYDDGENEYTIEGEWQKFEVKEDDKIVNFELKLFHYVEFVVLGGVNGVEITIYSDEERTQQVRDPIYAWAMSPAYASKELEDGEYWFTASLFGYEDYNGHFVVDGEWKEIQFEMQFEYMDVKLLSNTEGTIVHSAGGNDFIGKLYTKEDNFLYYKSYNLNSKDGWGEEEQIAEATTGRLAIDLNDNPHIVYVTEAPDENDAIGYRMHNGTDWTSEVLIESEYDNNCSMPDIDTDSQGYAHITYTDVNEDGDNNIMYAENTSGDFQINMVKEGGWCDDESRDFFYNKGSYIALDGEDYYYIATHVFMTDIAKGGVNQLLIFSKNEENTVSPPISEDDFNFIDFISYDGVIFPLMLVENNTVAYSIPTEEGEIVFAPSLFAELPIDDVYSFATNGKGFIFGAKDGDYMQLFQNEVPIDMSQPEVEGDAVSVVYAGDNFYALYDPVFYTVNFDENEGDTQADPSSMEVEGGLSLNELPTQPIRDGYIFVEWNTQDDGEGEIFDEETVVTDDITVFAKWREKETFTLTVEYDELRGTVEVNDVLFDHEDSDDFEETTEINIEAIPEEGYRFGGWTATEGTFEDSSEEITIFTMPNSDATITANFLEIQEYTVNFEVVGENGDIEAEVAGSSIEDGDEVEEGEDVLFTAIPDAGYQVKEWTLNGGVVADHIDETFLVEGLDENITVTLEFEEIPTVKYTVNFEVVGENGDIEAEVAGNSIEDGDEVEEGEDVLFTAIPDAGYQVKEWTLNGGVVADHIDETFLVEGLDENITVKVEFEEIPTVLYTVNFEVVGENGDIEAEVDGNSIEDGDEVEEGEDVLFTAIPDAGYQVKEWTLNGDVVEDHIDETLLVEGLDENITVTVEFEEDLFVADFDKYNLSIYPNPASKEITIQSNKNINEIKLVSISGQVVENKNIEGLDVKINVSNLNPGTYFIKIYLDETVITEIIQIVP